MTGAVEQPTSRPVRGLNVDRAGHGATIGHRLPILGPACDLLDTAKATVGS